MAELNFSPGDEIVLRLAHEEVRGIALESPESSIVMLKLSSGYNIGISKENILGCEVVKKNLVSKLKKEEIVKNPELPSIGLVITGGTIAAKLNPKTGGVHWLTDLDEFRRFYPELFKVTNVKTIIVPFMTSSEAMTSEHWITIAEAVKPMLDNDEIKGVVVTHGTDFLHYTGAALSFFLKNLNKPVVLTYSQRSIDRASSDANLNLQCAARMALSEAAEVMLVGHANLDDDFCYALRGNKVRKMHSSRRDAFKPVNTEPIAKVWPDRVEYISSFKKRNEGKPELDADYSDKVALVKFYPGQDPSILDFYALKYKGIVVEAAGLGHLAPAEARHSWLAALKKHIRAGFVVCAAAQTINGRLDPYVYSNGRELVDAGVIFLEDMLAETALVKLGYVLGHYGWKKSIKDKMLENFAGELNEKLSV
ncbi:Glu-tRNA(Gln) amidotransferase subunit GatD [Candidatus Pacearchaeota archaeon]|nr:Glu-tRNA(Gln) amidotransferase subunit GatD [Candidatus Pacearchaeota archaeon]